MFCRRFTPSTNRSSKTAGFYIQKPAVFFTESISKNLALSIISVFAADFLIRKFDRSGNILMQSVYRDRIAWQKWRRLDKGIERIHAAAVNNRCSEFGYCLWIRYQQNLNNALVIINSTPVKRPAFGFSHMTSFTDSRKSAIAAYMLSAAPFSPSVPKTPPLGLRRYPFHAPFPSAVRGPASGA